MLMDGDTSVIFTQLGANDPQFNLRNEHAFIQRKVNQKKHTFVSILEPHGEYNPSKEFTVGANSTIQMLSHSKDKQLDIVEFGLANNQHYLLAFNAARAYQENQVNQFTYNGTTYHFDGRFKLFALSQ